MSEPTAGASDGDGPRRRPARPSLRPAMLRKALLLLARSERVRSLAVSLPVTRRVVARFVPGVSVEDCLDAVRSLAADGLLATVDFLGEDTSTATQADHVTATYLGVLERLSQARLSDRAEVSIKLTALGLALPDGTQACLARARAICAAARAAGTTVTVDMEDHTVTDATLHVLSQLRADFPETGGVLQAYLLRTPSDCRALRGPGSRIRLCKGAYAEPAQVAHQSAPEVAEAYVRCLSLLMAGEGYPMVATHDPAMIAAAQELAAEHGRRPGDFEFQMLYGIRADEQRRLSAAGHRVRVYVPFGSDWWGYFVRRLAERPANLAFFARALVGS